MALRGCGIIVRSSNTICVSESMFDTPVLNTVIICGKHNPVSAENCWQVCVLVISHAGRRLYIYFEI